MTTFKGVHFSVKGNLERQEGAICDVWTTGSMTHSLYICHGGSPALGLGDE